ncbi:MAG: nitroreductase family protein [Bacteroidales bacterium]
MDVIEAIINRRSIRNYTGQQVTAEQVEVILRAAMYAPSAVNKQPWHFIVFRDKKIREEIIEFHPNAWMLKNASLGILVCYDENLQHDSGYGEVDCGAATQNILLAAHGIGLGAVWIGIYPRQQRISAIHQLFKLPSNIKPFSVIAVGYPNEKKTFPERYQQERIHYESW